MRIRRLKKKYRLRVWLIMFTVFLIGFILIPRSNRALVISFFSKKCRNYQQVYSNRLNDRVIDYYAHARTSGIDKCLDEDDINERISARQLYRVRSRRYYKVENLTHSYPYLIQDSKKLLNEIGKRFKGKINREGFKGSRFIVTSMTRTAEMAEGLGKTNINASDNSPHLNGNAFDISYSRFSFLKLHITDCDKWYMKEALAEVICQFKEEGRCWATYERNQGCFHIVSR
jgi:hypothetical protein